MPENTDDKIDRLSKELLKLSHDSIAVEMRFLGRALNRLVCRSYEGTLATDGRSLFYDKTYLLKKYKDTGEAPTRDYLHILLHCVFRHMFVGPGIRKDVWNLACDIAVESAISAFGPDTAKSAREPGQQAASKLIRISTEHLTAEKIYRYLLAINISDREVRELGALFGADDHTMWYSRGAALKAYGITGAEQSSDSISADGAAHFSLIYGEAPEAVEEEWKKISVQIKSDLENFSKKYGKKASNLVNGIDEVNRERYDYADFLKKFAVMGEVMKVNDNEFDNVFYTYGLSLYGNMPLIEPLEYKEEKRVREFVIAIDTSGSVQGKLVQAFIRKTCNILMQEENFFSKINVHIIQCDADIQTDTKITSAAELEQHISELELHGFGGTDFRPVFKYVEYLRSRHEITELGGLVYFTDGWGSYPKSPPDYNTAFVFVGDDTDEPPVPPWAITLRLPEEDIEAFDKGE